MRSNRRAVAPVDSDMNQIVAALLVLTLVAGCVHDVAVTYPGDTPSAGTIAVVLNDPTRALTVTVDGELVVDRAYTRRARIDGVPAGPARVSVSTGGGCEAGRAVDYDVEVVPGRVTTIPLPGPEPNTGCMVYQGLYYVGLEVGLVALAILATSGPATSDHRTLR